MQSFIVFDGWAVFKKSQQMLEKDLDTGKESLTRATSKWAMLTSGRSFPSDDIILEERVDPAHVVELEYDGPAGLGDLVEGFLLEEGLWKFGGESN